MADAQHLLQFFEGGVGMLFDVGSQFFRVELAPSAPTGFSPNSEMEKGSQ
jgi:hypothetical protein